MVGKEILCKKLTEEKQAKETAEMELKAQVGHHMWLLSSKEKSHFMRKPVFGAVWPVRTEMSRLMTKPAKWHVCPAKTQISLGIRPVWSVSSLSAWRNHGSLASLRAHSEDSGQIGRMPRLIWVFVGCTCHFVGFVMRRLKSACSATEASRSLWNFKYSN